MNTICTRENQTALVLDKACVGSISNQLNEVCSTLHTTSKEKYAIKSKLIENAKDLTTSEKLLALDANYDRHNQEMWQNIFLYGFASLTLLCFLGKSPVIAKISHRLIA